MKITPLLMLATASVVIYANHDRPRVAWVPIESRNISEVVGKALEGSEERLVRIGKMLTESYDKMARDTEEGEAKIRELEEFSSSSIVTPMITAIMISILGYFYL
ncbi:hypothetical protein GCK32_003518 [Trichostrongylus colubriformis]|uniref:Uncharacterized protein n=1 Tax=Trichostrongylus colubriformis TaxID=6319 RepID=A0AAN8FVG7_TRICO